MQTVLRTPIQERHSSQKSEKKRERNEKKRCYSSTLGLKSCFLLLLAAAMGSSPKILYPSQFACHACLACQSYALQEGVTSLGKAAKQQNDNVIASTKKRQKTILANNNPSNQQQQAQKQLQTR